MALLFVAPYNAFSKRHDFSVYLQNGVLLNKLDHHLLDGNKTYADVKNTFRQSIGLKYSKLSKSSILLSCGVELGYDKYSAKINYPFVDFGFYPPAQNSPQYNFKATIPYSQIDVNIGYRFTKMTKIQPEVRLGHGVRIPLHAKSLRHYSHEYATTGFLSPNMFSYGSYGKPLNNSFVLEMVNYVYMGVNSPPSIKKKFAVSNVGVQFQRQLFFSNTPLNHFNITYFNLWGDKQSSEEFIGSHSSVNFVIGFEIWE